MKKALAWILLLAMTLSFTACSGGSDTGDSAEAGSSDQVYEFTLATTNPLEAIDTQCAEKIVERMEEETGGKVKITLYPAGQLGDLTQIYDEVIAGTIDMSLTSVLWNLQYFERGNLSAVFGGRL